MGIKILIILALSYMLIRESTFLEGFSNDKKADDIHNNKNLFINKKSYSEIKEKIPWIDPIVYDDMHKLSLQESMTQLSIKRLL